MRIPSVLDYSMLTWRFRELLWSFIWRDLKSRYTGSLLGRLWPLLNPLILFAVYYFVFAVIMDMKMQDLAGKTVGSKSLMGLYIISGILPWLFFSDAILRCTGVVLENGNLVKKIAFPSQLLPAYVVAVNFVYFMIGLVVFLAARFLFFYDLGELPDGTVLVGLPDSWFLIFLAIPLQVVFSTGLGMFLGALNIFIRDTTQVATLFLQLWFFTTPIVYPATLITENLPDQAYLMKLNPMYHLMEMYRAALIYDYGSTPWNSVLIFAICAVAVFWPGHAFFVRTKGRFADEL